MCKIIILGAGIAGISLHIISKKNIQAQKSQSMRKPMIGEDCMGILCAFT